MKVNVFGATSFTGTAFLRTLADWVGCSGIFTYSRDPECSCPVDMSLPATFMPASGSDSSIWVAFAPIWIFAPFFHAFASKTHNLSSLVSGVIACSSSSVLAKRFSANTYDQSLVARLCSAENLLLETCRSAGVPCRILRPALVYGKSGNKGDLNLSRIIVAMRYLPILPLPAFSGLRQPIHASQLGAVILELVKQIAEGMLDPFTPECIAIGGDSELTYTAMLLALQQSLPPSDSARNCRLISIPNRFFFLLCAFLLFRSTRDFEAGLRMASNLSGFTPCHQIHGGSPSNFPVLPLA